MESKFKKQFQGTRWQIAYGSWEETENLGAITIQKKLQQFLPYVIEVKQSNSCDTQGHLCIIGFSNSNHLLQQLTEKGLLIKPTKLQGFSISCCPSPWAEGKKIIAVTAKDEEGLLYGAHFLNAHILSRHLGGLRPVDCPTSLENLPTIKMTEAPQVKNRGIWTWGYPIYDYRKFIDNMAILRMNMLTIWNDVPPVNINELLSYAHKNCIKVVLGFAWGWGTTIDLSDAEQRRKIRTQVVETYIRDYSNLDIDGIYFQTLTEHSNYNQGDRTTADLVCEFVNEIAEDIFTVTPSLYLQFGLHASSISENYSDLKSLHPGITIVWEDAGGIPYMYQPEIDPNGNLTGNSKMKEVLTPEETLSYSKKISALRGNGKEFALVPKGWSYIDWTNEFENHGPFIIGERSNRSIRKLAEHKENYWDILNQAWFKFYPVAATFYREMLKITKGPLTVTGLIEDGAFERKIEPSVSLFAETLWNPSLDDSEILCRAMSPYYNNDLA